MTNTLLVSPHSAVNISTCCVSPTALPAAKHDEPSTRDEQGSNIVNYKTLHSLVSEDKVAASPTARHGSMRPNTAQLTSIGSTQPADAE